jgi:hypothetical protein
MELETLFSEGVSAVVLEPLLIILYYQQRVIYSGSEITSDSSLEPLQMTFYVVVCRRRQATLHTCNTLAEV